jgi:hypothetical protein
MFTVLLYICLDHACLSPVQSVEQGDMMTCDDTARAPAVVESHPGMVRMCVERWSGETVIYEVDYAE